MKAVFRVDASRRIGGGHVMRCLTLADALRAEGWTAHFLSRRAEGHLGAAIQARGHGLTLLPAGDPDYTPPSSSPFSPPFSAPAHAAWAGVDPALDAAETRAAAPADCDWLILDHYAFDAAWIEAVGGVGRRLMAIDDLDDRPLPADLLLDQSRVSGLGPRHHEGARTLTGPAYALLRPEFAAARAESLARRGRGLARPPRILVSTGMMDVGGAALAAAAALSSPAPQTPFAGRTAIDVAVGAQAKSADDLRALARERPAVSLHLDARDMAGLMGRADLAVGAVGATTWERFCLGLPAMVFVLAENQRAIAEALAADGLVGLLGAPEPRALEDLVEMTLLRLANPDFLQQESRRISALCDGLGAQKVVAAMQEMS